MPEQGKERLSSSVLANKERSNARSKGDHLTPCPEEKERERERENKLQSKLTFLFTMEEMQRALEHCTEMM